MDQSQVLPLSRLPTVTSDSRFLPFRLTVYILYNLHLSSPSFSFYVVGPVPTYARDGPETFVLENTFPTCLPHVVTRLSILPLPSVLNIHFFPMITPRS